MTRENIKIEVRRNLQLTRVGQNRIDEPGVIENAVARFGVAEEIDEGDVIGLGTGQSPDNELEVRRGKPLPTIRPDHRRSIMSISDAAWQACDGIGLVTVSTLRFALSPLRRRDVGKLSHRLERCVL